MQWYISKLVYQIICNDGNHTPQFDEQLRLIWAEDRLHALLKAQQMGEKEQDQFYNNDEKLVQWKFIDVSDLQTIAELSDGVEIYSSIKEEKECAEFIHTTRMKASYILEQSLDLCVQTA